MEELGRHGYRISPGSLNGVKTGKRSVCPRFWLVLAAVAALVLGLTGARGAEITRILVRYFRGGGWRAAAPAVQPP